jgi:hypothetical protein
VEINCLISRDVAELIKRCIPDTYAMVETMESDQFGSLPVKKAKGEGGLSDLATRIGNNYYNDYLRYPELQPRHKVANLGIIASNLIICSLFF